jgi:drug/metabolite transporter (DMT)-like permease
MTRAEANIVLFSITLCWASSYIFIKNLPPNLSSYAYMTMTAGLAAVILAIVFWQRLRELKGRLLLRSAIMAAIICANLVFERLGISRIPASTASFVAALSIVFVPLFLLLLKQKPTRNNLLGIAFILCGLILTSGIHRGASLELGVLYMVVACIFMAIYIIVVDYFTKKDDPLLLGVGQMFFTAGIAFLLWCIEEPKTFFSLHYTNEMLANIFLLAFLPGHMLT